MTVTITPLSPETLYSLEARAERVHPDQPIATGSEALTLVRQVRDLDGVAVAYAMQTGRVRDLAREWINSPDIQIAAAGRILARTLDGAHTVTDLI